jgi:hypothetical protein
MNGATMTTKLSTLNTSDIYSRVGKSTENIYEPNISGGNNEELSAEMANLEGIMKDLNAITAQQFEC